MSDRTVQSRTSQHHSSRLKKGSIGAVGVVAMCIAFMGPVTSVAFNTHPAVGGAGLNLPLSMGMAMIACLLVANTISQFARKIPSAGFALSFNSHAFGPIGGVLTGWVLLLGYAMVAPMMFCAIGYFTGEFIGSVGGPSIPWWILTIAYAVIVWGINSLGISESARASLIFVIIEVGVLLALFLTVLGKGGAEGLSLEPFNPVAGGVGVSGLGIGMLWGIMYFIGFESAATLGEEAERPERTIPRALFASVLVIGSVYVLAAYSIVMGFGPGGIDALVADETPLVTIGQTFWGIIWLISLTILASQFANMVAGSNAAVRIVFSLGRTSILPHALGHTDKKGIPQIALGGYLALSLALALVGGSIIGPLGVYGLAGTVLGIVMVVVYIAMNIGLIWFYRREHRDEFSTLKHLILPVISSLVMLLPLYGQLVPLPPMPNLIGVVFIGVWLLAGITYVLVLRQNRPQRLQAGVDAAVGDADNGVAATDESVLSEETKNLR